jgi:hypothetical protein
VTDRLKFVGGGGGGPLTINVAEVVFVRPPPTPWIVNGYVPGVVLMSALTVNVEDAGGVIGFGLKPLVMPEGNPIVLKVTAELKFVAVVLIV